MKKHTYVEKAVIKIVIQHRYIIGLSFTILFSSQIWQLNLPIPASHTPILPYTHTLINEETEALIDSK